MTTLIRSEAIVLKTIAFKEYDRILTLFSPQGLFKLFAKGKKKDYFRFAALTSPLTQGEFHYSPGRKELHRLHEGSILNQNLNLRERYETLIAAEQMIRALLQSQWLGKPAPKLYHLFTLFLGHIPKIQDPALLVTTFLLKTLAHEGNLQIEPIQAAFRYCGEIYERHEAPNGALFFAKEEESLLVNLASLRSLKELSNYTIDKEFQSKIETLFNQTFHGLPN